MVAPTASEVVERLSEISLDLAAEVVGGAVGLGLIRVCDYRVGNPLTGIGVRPGRFTVIGAQRLAEIYGLDDAHNPKERK